MARPRGHEHIDCFFTNGLWLPGRLVLLSGDIDDEAFRKLYCGLEVLTATSEPIQVVLNTSGGSAIDGIAVYDAISHVANHVTIQVLGQASSMGAVMLQAADSRTMAPHAVLMLHDGTDSVADLHVRDFERRAEESKRTREEMYQIFADRSGKSKSHFRRRLGRDCYYTAEQALKEGLIDGIAGRP